MSDVIEFDIGTALYTAYDDDGFLTVQIDAYGGQQSGVIPYEVHSPHGLLTRPHDPDDDGECQVLYGLEGGRGHAWFCSDPRVIPYIPQITKGGTVLYGGKVKAPSYTAFDGDTNSVVTYVPYQVDENGIAQKAMTFAFNVDNEGSESIEVTHGSGASFYIAESGGSVSVVLKNASGSSYIEVNDDGIVLNGSVTVQGGFNAGGPGGAQNLVLGPPLVALLQQLITIVAAINPTTPGAPAASLAGQLSGILALNSKGA